MIVAEVTEELDTAGCVGVESANKERVIGKPDSTDEEEEAKIHVP